MDDAELDGEDRVYTDPELVEDFLQNILWPILECGPNSVAFLTNRSDLTDLFGPGMTEEEYQQVADAVNQRYGLNMPSRECGNIAYMLEYIRDHPETKRVWQ